MAPAAAGGEFCVDVSLSNSEAVRRVDGALVDVPDEFELVSVQCTARTPGFSCTGNEVPATNRIDLVVQELGGGCIAVGAGPIAQVCLRDKAPQCPVGTAIQLALENTVVTACDSRALGVCEEPGTAFCGERGDCEAEGDFDLFDILEMIDVVLQVIPPTLDQEVLCDADCDTDIDLFDILLAIDMLLQRIPRPLMCPSAPAAPLRM